MSHSVFLTAPALHTSLGFGMQAHSDKLKFQAQDLLALPKAVPLPVSLDEEPSTNIIPFHVLADLPLDVPSTRYYAAVERVLETCIKSSALSADELSQTPLYIGTSCADVPLIETSYHSALKTNAAAQPLDLFCSMDNLGSYLRETFGLSPEGMSVNTACTASANALLYAYMAIQSGRAQHAIVMGTEILNVITAYGFQSLELLTQTSMRPFDARRDGLVLGEAVSAVILSANRPDGPSMELLGGATLSDDYGMSAANPDGTSIARVMRKAIENSGMATADITAVKAHGTASLLNDEGESAGLHQVFDTLPIVTCLKPFIGHTFGASGLTELLILNACLNDGFLPGLPGIADLALEPLNIVLNQSPLAMRNPTLLVNQFGFGGNNTSLVLRHG